MSWQVEQEEERTWWGACTNTLGEELKQMVYAEYMGLMWENTGGPGPVIRMGERSIVDVGGGPASLLLKVETSGNRSVIDPCYYPSWTRERYEAAGVAFYKMKGEEFAQFFSNTWDECWIYNVLQHTEDPEAVIANARKAAKKIRLFEWIDMPVSPGHPHTLTEMDLTKWLRADRSQYRTVEVDERGAVGRAFTGVFYA